MASILSIKNKNTNLFVSVLAVIAVGSLALFFYNYVTDRYSDLIKKDLSSVARTAAITIDASKLEGINLPDDVTKLEFKEIVAYLGKIRNQNPGIKFIYIMRKTDDPKYLSFVVDVDIFGTLAQLDDNKNGVLEESEKPALPGERYNISNFPAMSSAFVFPTADKAVASDKWGDFISGYAPIVNAVGRPVAILGVDLAADDYYAMQGEARIGLFAVMIVLLVILALIFIQTTGHNREVQTLRDAEAQKTDFISLISYQLSTPLSASKQIIEGTKKSLPRMRLGDIEKAFDELASINKRMIALVYDLMRVSGLDMAKPKFEFEKIKITDLVRGAISQLGEKITKSGVDFHETFDLSNEIIETDKSLVTEVLVNLLSNAVKYTPAGKLLEVYAHSDSKRAYIGVRDGGIGIKEGDEDRRFTKFYRSAGAIARDPNGTGLGLFFARRALSALGGDIQYSRESNGGANFYFYLPLERTA